MTPSTMRARLDSTTWGRDLVIDLPDPGGSSSTFVECVLFDPEGRPLQSASSHTPATRDAGRCFARCIVNNIPKGQAVGRVRVDRVDQDLGSAEFSPPLTPDGCEATLDQPLVPGVVARQLTFLPVEGGTWRAQVLIDVEPGVSGTVDLELEVTRGGSRAGARTTVAPLRAGCLVLALDDLDVPDDADPEAVPRLVVRTLARVHRATTPLGEVEVAAGSWCPPAGNSRAVGGVRGSATLDARRLRWEIDAIPSDGAEVRPRVHWTLRDRGVPVWGDTIEPSGAGWSGAMRVKRPLGAGPFEMEVRVQAVRRHEVAFEVHTPTEPNPPVVVPAVPSVGPVILEGVWSYHEDRIGIGSFSGVWVLVRNAATQACVVHSTHRSGTDESSSEHQLQPGASALLQTDCQEHGPGRVELRVDEVVGPEALGVLPVDDQR